MKKLTTIGSPLLLLAVLVCLGVLPAAAEVRLGAGPSPPTELPQAPCDPLPAPPTLDQPTGIDRPALAEGGPEAVGSAMDPEAVADWHLAELRRFSESGIKALPEVRIEELASLVSRHPELESRIVTALGEARGLLRAYLHLVILKVVDGDLRHRLEVAWRESDPTAAQIRETFAEPARIARAIVDPGDRTFRLDFLSRLRGEHLADPQVLNALKFAASSEPDRQVRMAAIAALGRHAGEAGESHMLSILTDRSIDTDYRTLAAFCLRKKTSEEIVRTLKSILRTRDVASIMRHATDGLKTSVDDPEVRELLFEVLNDPAEDLTARKNAARSLTGALRVLEGPDRDALERRISDSAEGLRRADAPECLVARAAEAIEKK
jgi:hypothetical protein